MRLVNTLITIAFLLLLSACQMKNKDQQKTMTETNLITKKETTMEEQSNTTLEVAMKYMDAMGKGDMETMISLMDDEMIWHNEGDKSMPWIGPWSGKKVILEEFLPLFMEHLKTTKWDTEDAFASGDTAAFFGRMKALALKSNVETEEFTFALRVKVKEGKIILWNWLEDSYAVSKAFHGK